MTNYPMILTYLVPGAKIRYQGVEISYEDVEWLDERTQPTKAECDDAWPQFSYEMEYASVKRARRARYQEETDGMYFSAQRDGGDLTEWIAAVDAIKAELPYPLAP